MFYEEEVIFAFSFDVLIVVVSTTLTGYCCALYNSVFIGVKLLRICFLSLTHLVLSFLTSYDLSFAYTRLL